jgi:DNA-binding transcriptional LysR family regulator
MELRHLRYFVAVAEAGNLSRAAEKLFIAQPPLSLQIRQLEEEVGTPLFSRHPKGMKLTPAGEALLPNARDLLERAAGLADAAGKAAGAGTLTLGFVPSAGSTVLPGLVRRLRGAQPRVELRLAEMISDEQQEALVAGRIDGGLARSASRHPHLHVACSLADPFCLALPAARDGVLPDVIDLRRLASESFVAFTRHRGPAYFDRTIRLCGDAGFSPRIRFEASTLHGVLDLVGADLGVALVPATAVLLEARGVTLRRLRQRTRGDVLTLLTRRRDMRSMVKDLTAAVSAIFAELRPRLAALSSSGGKGGIS